MGTPPRLAILALLLAACGMSGDPAGTSSPPAETTTTPPIAEHDFAAARANWHDAGLDTYRFTFEDDCGECMPAGPRLVVVRGGEAEDPSDPTVDSLFETIALALGEETSVEVTYHSELGYPTEIWIDREARAYDGGTHWLIRDLEAGLPDPETSTSELEAARQRWIDAGYGDYRYDLVTHDIVEASFSAPYTVTVSDGLVLDVEFQGAPEDEQQVPGLTIDDWFELIEEEGAAGSIVEVIYHDQDGHPVFLAVRDPNNTIPPSLMVSIHELTPLP